MSSGQINSDNSWIKHQMARNTARSQIHAARHNWPAARMLFIDGNAGDAVGVALVQGGLFGQELSETTPEVLVRLAGVVGNTDVILCERNLQRRRLLQTRFPGVMLLKDNADVPSHINPHLYDYAIWLSDPCGYSKHGVDAMAEIARMIPKSDFVIAFNEGELERARGDTRERYYEMSDPQWWMVKLNKRFLARNQNIIQQSPRFGLRLMVVSNYIANGARNLEIITRRR